jgi:hypothetical protein
MMGVHTPGIRRIPDNNKKEHVTTTFKGGSLHRIEFARITKAEPRTSRMRSKPIPGQPPANVEYKRRKDAPFLTFLESYISLATETPNRVLNFTLSSVV